MNVSLPSQSSEAVATFDKLAALNTLILPKRLSYIDDFTGNVNSLELSNDLWSLQIQGKDGNKVSFKTYTESLKHLLKVVCADCLSNYTPATTFTYFNSLELYFDEEEIRSVLLIDPSNLKFVWEHLKVKKAGVSNTGLINAQLCLKFLLKYLCSNHLLGWSPSYNALVTTISLSPYSKHRVIKDGSCFLTLKQEAKIISYIDDFSNHLDDCNPDKLRNICLLICSYQFGMRPSQIGSVKRQSVKFLTQDDGSVSIYISFYKVKQRSASKAIPLVRAVKKEWCSIFVEYNSHSKTKQSSQLFFDVSSSYETSILIADTAENILGVRRSPNDFRHSAAQRLVDAGASKEELAEFLGHSDLDTCLIYFDVSATQAERVNKALGLSETYSQLATIAHNKFIDADELKLLKDEQQIAGIPHGFPISGIGGCESGQPNCPFNPITSCYGCPKFMPMNQVEVHRDVLHSMRLVVKQFVDAGLDDNATPAFLQLRHVIVNIEAVINELEPRVPSNER